MKMRSSPVETKKTEAGSVPGSGFIEVIYRVGTFRAAGLQAKWSKTRQGRPVIVANDAKHSHQWYAITDSVLERMKR